MKLSNETKRRFVKDYKLPIPVVEEPYFSHFLALSEGVYGGMSAYRMLIDEINTHGSEKKFSEYRHNLIFNVIRNITKTEEWKHFHLNDPTKNLEKLQIESKETFYQEKNKDLEYISLDLKEANFQSLKYLSDAYVLKTKSFKELLLRHTSSPYFLNSKPFRQLVFVNKDLFPQRQARVQNHLVRIAYDRLMEMGVSEPIFCNQDEMIFIKSDENIDLINLFLKEQDEVFGATFNLSQFELKMIHPTKSMFAKYYLDGRIEIKNIDKSFIPEVLRQMNGQCSIKMDRAFMYEGRIACYEKGLYEDI